MSTSIEDKVVSLKFDNVQFTKGVGDSQKSLIQLNKALQMKDGLKGLDGIEARAARFNLSVLGEAPGMVAEKFNLLASAAAVALGNIASKAISTGATLLNSFTMKPIIDGFGEYETKMGSIQTILANTASKGTTLSQVTSALDSLNTYADKTIYNFAEMTHNIGLFTNAGLGVEESASMIKGFSNAAAASGTTSSAAANAAYQLSQALSAGTIKLMDWRSLTNAGMGNKNMQEGLIQIAQAMGTFAGTSTNAEKATQDFNGSLSEGWLSADVMSKYLQIMAGDMDDAAMSALGLTDAQIEQFKVQQKNAEEAATKVRTFSQLISTIQETIGSGWAKTFEILLGNFDEASELFTNINNVVSPMIDGLSDARNALLQGWADLGGRKDIIDGLASAFNSVSGIIGTVAKAFKDIFPPVTAENLKTISEGFKNFMKALEPSEESLRRLGIVAKTVFAFMKVFTDTVLAGFKVMSAGVSRALQTLRKALDLLPVGKVIDSLDGVGEKLSSWTGIADVAAKSIENINRFFDFLDGNLEKLKPMLTDAIKEFMTFFNAWTAGLSGADGAGGFASKWQAALDKVKAALASAKEAVVNFFKTHFNSGVFTGIWTNIKKTIENFTDWVKSLSIGTVIKNSLLTGGIATVITGIVRAFQMFMNVLHSITAVSNSTAGMLDSIRNAISAYETSIKADALKKVAMSILFLAAALFVLSLLPMTNLAVAVTAMGASLAALVGGLVAMDKWAKDGEKAIKLAIAVVLMAGAVVLMSLAAKKLSDVPIASVATATTAVSVLLAALTGMARFMSGGKGAIKNVLLMVGMAAAVYILAAAVGKISSIPADQLKSATLTIISLNVAIGVMAKVIGQTKIKAAPLLGMIGAAAALNKLSKVIGQLGAMDIGVLKQGITATLILMVAMAILMRVSNMGSPSFASALQYITIAIAIEKVGVSVERLGALSVSSLVAGVTAIILIMVAMALMAKLVAEDKGVKSAFKGMAFFGVAMAVAKLANVIVTLGSLDQGALIQGSIALALIMTTMGLLMIAMANFTNAGDMVATAVTFMAAAIAVYMVGLSISQLATLPMEGVVVAVGALLIAMAGIALIASLAQASMGGAAAMLMLSIAVIALATGLAILAGIGLEGIAIALVSLAIGLGILIGAAYLAQGASLGLLLLTVAIVGIGLACLLAGVGVLILGVGMGVLVAALVAAGAVGWAAIIKMTVGLLLFAVAGLLAAPAALALGAAMLMMGAGLTLAGVGMGILSNTIPKFVNAVNQGSNIGVTATTKLTAAIAAIGAAAAVAGPGMMLLGTGLALAGAGLLVLTAAGGAAAVVLPLLASSFSFAVSKMGTAVGALNPHVTAFSTNATTMSTTATDLNSSVSTAFNGMNAAITSCIPMMLAACAMFQSLGPNVVSNISTGIATATPQVQVAMTTLVMTMFTTFVSRIGMGQPMVYAGMLSLASHISLALSRVTSMVASSIKSLVMNMTSALSSGLSAMASSLYGPATQVGYYIAQGMNDGLANQRGALMERARAVAAAMVQAANAELQIHSPSRVFKKTGYWAAKGLEVGWTETAVDAVDAVTRTAEEFEKEFRNIVESIDMDEISDDFSPVITPVLDLSEAKASADDLRSMFGAETFRGVQNTASGIGSRPSEQSSQNGSGKTVIFNQYNNSPKALSETEIYRQTKSSISRIARV